VARTARSGFVRIPANYTVGQCLKDWLETLSTQAETTMTGYQIVTRHLVELIGSIKLTELEGPGGRFRARQAGQTPVHQER
jgi:hypothetical protein